VAFRCSYSMGCYQFFVIKRFFYSVLYEFLIPIYFIFLHTPTLVIFSPTVF